jgi:hypothetical protein
VPLESLRDIRFLLVLSAAYVGHQKLCRCGSFSQ